MSNSCIKRQQKKRQDKAHRPAKKKKAPPLASRRRRRPLTGAERYRAKLEPQDLTEPTETESTESTWEEAVLESTVSPADDQHFEWEALPPLATNTSSAHWREEEEDRYAWSSDEGPTTNEVGLSDTEAKTSKQRKAKKRSKRRTGTRNNGEPSVSTSYNAGTNEEEKEMEPLEHVPQSAKSEKYDLLSRL